MNKNQLKDASIDVFRNNGPVLIQNNHFSIIQPGTIINNWSYNNLNLNVFNDPNNGHPDHPFIHVRGGFEEGQNGFNKFLHQSMNNVNFFHNKDIITLPHSKFDKHNFELRGEIKEKPDLFEVDEVSKCPPFYKPNPNVNKYKRVISAMQAGHNHICQTENGILDKMCYELWRLLRAGIQHCFYIALYSHKQNLTLTEQNAIPNQYANTNLLADQNYVTELQGYCNNISMIDLDYIHLIFKGERPSGNFTFFHVFIIERQPNVHFHQVIDNGILRTRPYNYVI